MLKTNSKGFTLIELLVAITIFSLVVGMAMFTMRHYFTVVQHLDAPFAEDTQKLSQLRDCIAGTYNYVTPSRDMFNNRKDYSIFFKGEIDSVTFISTSPPSGRIISICKLYRDKESVILEEAPLYADDSNYLEPTLEGREKKMSLIAKDVSVLRLEYLYNGKKGSTLKSAVPTLVKISITSDSIEKDYYVHIPSNYDEKALLMRGLNDPI